MGGLGISQFCYAEYFPFSLLKEEQSLIATHRKILMHAHNIGNGKIYIYKYMSARVLAQKIVYIS